MMSSRSVVVLAVALGLAVVACGEDDGETTAPPTDVGPDDGAVTNDTAGSGGDDAPAEGGTGTISLADGTEYRFTMTTCKTNETDPSSFLVDPGYELFGTSEDGFKMSFIRAGLSEDTSPVGSLDGEFDENGVNPAVSYAGVNDDVDLQVDGGQVTGTALLNSFETDEDVEAVIDVAC